MFRAILVFAAAGLVTTVSLLAQGNDAGTSVLLTCADVRALSRDQAARGLPVKVRGVVTLVPSDSKDSFTVDDGTGIWVGTTQPNRGTGDTTALRVGDLVEVAGQSHAGHFAPTISATTVRRIGREYLPQPRPIVQLSLESGVHDSQRVVVNGVVQAVERVTRGERTELKLLVATPTGHFTYLLYDPAPSLTANLVDAQVSLVGVFLSFFNPRREFLGVRIYSNDSADITVLRLPKPNSAAVPEVALGDVMGFSARGIDLHRRRVRGTVTLSKPGHYFYLQDEQNALRVNTRQRDVLRPGDVVEATGFFQLDHHRAEMTEATFKVSGRDVPPVATAITREQAFARAPRSIYIPFQDFDDRLVAMRGRLVSLDDKRGEPLRLNLECDGVLVPAEFSGPQADSFMAGLRPNSELLVTGVCVLTFSESRPVVEWPTPVSLRILVRGPEDVRILKASSWWTPRRLWAALGITAAVLLIALTWVELLRRRVALRSSQLAEEMRARRDAAVEFESTLRERNRLAADLHDTTEQSLTGLALQLEATDALRDRAPDRSRHHLGLARHLLDRSREDLRRSIWNLRATALETNTLVEALREVAADRSADLAVRIVVTCDEPEHPLPEIVAGNLLLFAQEGITNALKHARATQIDLKLSFPQREVVLEVRDNGIGFQLENADGPKDGHFGLQGMRERIKRLGGRLEITSASGRGTVVAASVPQ